MGFKKMAQAPYPNQASIKSVSEFIKKCLSVADKLDGNCWYRGQGPHGTLVPGILRIKTPTEDARGNPVGKDFQGMSSGIVYTYMNFMHMLDEFKRVSRPYFTRLPADDFEWMFVMQHHGIPTRLLDWTSDPLVALYFAVGGSGFHHPDAEDNIAAEVWLIDPVSINKILDHNGVINLNVADWGHYIDPDANAALPICVNAPHIDERIVAQSGYFTLHGHLMQAFEQYNVFHPHMYKLTIDGRSANSIAKELSLLGYNHAKIYPGIDTIAQVIKSKYQTDFLKWIDQRPTMAEVLASEKKRGR